MFTMMPTSASRRRTRAVSSFGWVRSAVGAASAALLITGCGDKSLAPPATQASDSQFWDAQLEHHAVTLSTVSPYDTVRLKVTPRNVNHEPIAGLPDPVFRVVNSDNVIVLSDGTLFAGSATGAPVRVVASITVGNLTHADTAFVSVVDGPPPFVLDTLSIHPIPPDSAKTGVSPASFTTDRQLLVRAVDFAGTMIPVLYQDGGAMPVHVVSEDTTILKVTKNEGVFSGRVTGVRVGNTRLIASTLAFGIARADTLSYRVGQPFFFQAILSSSNSYGITFPHYILLQPDITIGTGGVVAWWIVGGGHAPSDSFPVDSVTVTFAPADIPNVAAPQPYLAALAAIQPFAPILTCGMNDCENGGNTTITYNTGNFYAASGRAFPVPGIYNYTIEPLGISARINVVDESAGP